MGRAVKGTRDILAKLSRRIQLMVGRCVIAAAKADGGRVLVNIEGLEDESSDACELAEPWGLTSVPKSGAEGVSLSVMGVRGHRVIVPMGDRRYRPKDTQEGETILFDDLGHQIEIRRDGIVIVSPDKITIGADSIEITASSATINGEAIATVTDEVEVGGGSSAGRWPIVTGVGDG